MFLSRSAVLILFEDRDRLLRGQSRYRLKEFLYFDLFVSLPFHHNVYTQSRFLVTVRYAITLHSAHLECNQRFSEITIFVYVHIIISRAKWVKKLGGGRKRNKTRSSSLSWFENTRVCFSISRSRDSVYFLWTVELFSDRHFVRIRVDFLYHNHVFPSLCIPLQTVKLLSNRHLAGRSQVERKEIVSTLARRSQMERNKVISTLVLSKW